MAKLMSDEEAREFAVRLNALPWEEVTAELVRAASGLVQASELNSPGACHFGFVVALQRIQLVSGVVDMHGTDFEPNERRSAAPSSAAHGGADKQVWSNGQVWQDEH